MVISWILNTVSDEISNGMDFVITAQEVWDELNDQFSSINGHRVYQVFKDLHALEEGDRSVEIYYDKMKNHWDEYTALEPLIPCKSTCKCESHKLQEDWEQRKKLLQCLMGLNENFSATRGQILMMVPLPTVPQDFALVKQEERQRLGFSIPTSFIATVRISISNGDTNSATYASSLTSKRQSLKCSYCHKEGHLKETCYKLIGYPPKGRGREKFVGNNNRALPQAMQATGTIGSFGGPIGSVQTSTMATDVYFDEFYDAK
ncbi:uncharacterized protein LOC141701138 [Apium graveolens]|uniref:uncharacterized protein LOC141701138 n=1 Tax=Apium graveolens TaxID=4045 RepID=UPI003D7B953A